MLMKSFTPEKISIEPNILKRERDHSLNYYENVRERDTNIIKPSGKILAVFYFVQHLNRDFY